MGLNLRFDDDAPGSLLIENPSILESTTVPPAPVTQPPRRDDDPLEGFALGALPPATHRAFDDGVIAVRHLPVATVRRTTERAARRPGGLSLRTAAAFLVAGCCAGALVGLLQRPPEDDVRPGPSREAAVRLPPIALPPSTTAPSTTAPSTTATTTATPAATAAAAPATTMPTTPTPPTMAVVGTDNDGEPPAATAVPTTPTTQAATDAVPVDAPSAAAGAVVATAALTTGAAPTTAEKTPAESATDAPTTATSATTAATTAATTTTAATVTDATTIATAGKQKKKDGGRVRRGPVTAAPGRVEVSLPRAGRVQRAFALASPARVVVDLKGSDVPEGPLVVDAGGTREVRFGRPARKVDRVVVVLDGEQKPGEPHARVVGNRVVVTWRL
jgi:hypothetical protein